MFKHIKENKDVYRYHEDIREKLKYVNINSIYYFFSFQIEHRLSNNE